ncbi:MULTISPECIES: transcription antitermination factor NusB [Rathayibacter]|uniref:Transcription antitermination protein NusB n=2 Tax=Rathayibacter festucae TaxID=110937 RepID=A0A3T0T0N5_9MICO|nr:MULTISPECIES: transcription antitermination factor NusB [Rathayibacter]NQX17785.1 transcription antitermination factor NusB [Rathayibacter sp. VKM Ac-2857]AZZ52075.1 transcription antitermination factor NusB [Rathayibacter festucae DSM 15932]MCJ1674304.1 transcription antitermination factor NusB [Rathayibacter sp. VKM Ac-2929]MCJ1684585.1 transcription antitermination factor NusB [Rathayibacter sp. VKM Ac-2928]MCJ1687243.1 transcription antitermination factor NusB [Rathayibacter sp. VKM Ac-
MSARTKARKRALDIIYNADVRQISFSESLRSEAERAANEPAREASWLYAREIVDGVIDNADEIDALIAQLAKGWTLSRMPLVDRAILRIGVWEILHNDAVPDGVAISEAVEAATLLSTDDSAGFINGLLASVAESHATA